MKLRGQRALVTGGAVRIGRAITQALQAAGAEVVVHYRSSRREAEALSLFTIEADLSIGADCETLIDRVVQQYGPVDMLVNNASLFTKESLMAATPESVQSEFQLNLFAPMELIRRFAAQKRRGRIVNMLDRRIRCHDVSCVPYSLTKRGLEELTRLCALELAPMMTVNAVAPGPVLPPPGHSSASMAELSGVIPLGATPTVEAVARAVQFLVESEFITGQVIYVDGGQHLLGNGV
jgi:pteridine reductase